MIIDEILEVLNDKIDDLSVSIIDLNESAQKIYNHLQSINHAGYASQWTPTFSN